jgi:hypothetical protein
MSECYDLWRKVLLPNLLSNKPWANSSNDWTTAEKVELLQQVIQVGSARWGICPSISRARGTTSLKAH